MSVTQCLSSLTLAYLLLGLPTTSFAQCGPDGATSQTPIPGLFPTGVDSDGALLPGGAEDPYYRIISPMQPAVVISNPPPAWMNSGVAKWVWQQSNGQPTSVTRTFRLEFDLTGFDPTTASIWGHWASDDLGLDILINSHSTGNTSPGFFDGTPFFVTTGFVPGLNTLDFVVRDTGVIAGFKVVTIAGWACLEAPPVCVTFCDANGEDATPCPCQNDNDGSAPDGLAAGCKNSRPNWTGGMLRCAGSASIAARDLVLVATNVPAGVPGLFYQGNNQMNAGLGLTLGDGLRCVTGNIVRLQIIQIASNDTAMTTVNIPTLALLTPGLTRYYQFWHRDDPSPYTGGWRSNLTNGVKVNWEP